jgi:beta-lactamase superfamily II metal-dependent hydrolase
MAIHQIFFLLAWTFLPGKMKAVALMTPFGCGWLFRTQLSTPRAFCATMLDVGWGENFHLRYPDGTDALIDTGGFLDFTGKVSDFVGKRLISSYLWEERSPVWTTCF